MYALEAKHIQYAYTKKAPNILDDVSCHIKQHTFTALVGPNGCGKSTLFKCLSGILQPQHGEVYMRGEKIATISNKERAKILALIQQKNQLEAALTVVEIVQLGRLPYHAGGIGFQLTTNDIVAVDRAMEQVAITGLATKQFHNLSGGQQQRVWLALALAQEPEIILLDEPTTYLDVQFQLELLHLLKRLVAEERLTVCAILHDLNQVMQFADDVIVMKAGQILDKGNTKTVLNEALIAQAFHVGSTRLVNTNQQIVLDLYLQEEQQ